MAPVNILAFGDDRQHRIVAPLSLVLQFRHINIMDREDEVFAAKLALSFEERFEFELAIWALDGARRDNRDKEHGLLDCIRDFRFPPLTWIYGFLVLP